MSNVFSFLSFFLYNTRHAHISFYFLLLCACTYIDIFKDNFQYKCHAIKQSCNNGLKKGLSKISWKSIFAHFITKRLFCRWNYKENEETNVSYKCTMDACIYRKTVYVHLHIPEFNNNEFNNNVYSVGIQAKIGWVPENEMYNLQTP